MGKLCIALARPVKEPAVTTSNGVALTPWNDPKDTQYPPSRCQTKGATVCTLITNKGVQDFNPEFMGHTKANGPCLEQINWVPIRLIIK